MGETIPPVSKSQPATDRHEDPHESVTIAPPAPHFDYLGSIPTPVPALPRSSDAPDTHFRAALEAGSRAGTSLSDLSRIVADLSGGLSGFKRANEQLVQELSTLRAMLGSATEQELGLRQRLAEVEQELTRARAEAERERRFLTEQHDDFIAALVEEHEEALRASVAESETQRLDAQLGSLMQKLVAAEAGRVQVDQELTRARAEKRERERDELRAEASQLRARLGTNRASSTAPPPPSTSSGRPPSFRPPSALELDAGELDVSLHARAATPRLPSVVPRFTPHPPIASSRIPAAANASPSANAPTARAFPHESTRPGVGGPGPSEPPPPPSFGPPPSGWTPVPPAPERLTAPPRPPVISAASSPGIPIQQPALKQKPDPTTRPLVDYSLGGDGLPSETLEGARLSSKPPRK
jgi:hypothetical protein